MTLDPKEIEELRHTKIKDLKGTLVEDYGAFDTGIEFWVYTSVGKAFVMGPGTWPINGPYEFSKRDHIIGNFLNENDYEVEYMNEEALDEFIKENNIPPLPNDITQEMLQMDEWDLERIKRMAEYGCTPDSEYYSWEGDGWDECDFYGNEEEAIAAFLDCYVGRGDAWNLDDEDEEEYEEEDREENEIQDLIPLRYIQYHLDHQVEIDCD